MLRWGLVRRAHAIGGGAATGDRASRTRDPAMMSRKGSVGLVVCLVSVVVAAGAFMNRASLWDVTGWRIPVALEVGDYTAWTPPAVLARPDREHRFIFYHLRKCGGSTLRGQIMGAVRGLNAQRNEVDGGKDGAAAAKEVVAVVPCDDGQSPCDMYYLDRQRVDVARLESIAVVAGHFPLGEAQVSLNSHRWRKGPLSESGAPEGLDVFNNLHCLTQVRDPVARTMSCINFRFMQGGWLPDLLKSRGDALAISSLTPEEMDLLLREGVDEFGNGCSNEGLRMLSGVADEDLINKLTFDHPMAELLLEMAKHNMQRCVVLLAEDNDAKWRALDHWHPWIGLGTPSAEGRSKVVNQQSYAEKDPAAWNAALVSVIERRNQVDIELYEHAREIVAKQEAYLDSLARR